MLAYAAAQDGVAQVACVRCVVRDLRPLLKRPPRACSLPRLLGIYAAYTCYESGPFVLDLRSCFRCIFSRDCAAHQHNTEFKQQHLHGRKAKLNCKASSKSITQSKSILLATGNQHSSRQQRLHSSSKNDNGSNGNPSCRVQGPSLPPELSFGWPSVQNPD